MIHLELWVTYMIKFKSPIETTLLHSNNLLPNNKQYLQLIIKMQTNTNMVDSHFLKKYVFIHFFPFSYKAVKNPSSLFLILIWPILMKWPVGLYYFSVHYRIVSLLGPIFIGKNPTFTR